MTRYSVLEIGLLKKYYWVNILKVLIKRYLNIINNIFRNIYCILLFAFWLKSIIFDPTLKIKPNEVFKIITCRSLVVNGCLIPCKGRGMD